MVEGDDEPSARSAARDFADARATCFWDPERFSGAAWSRDYQARFAQALLTAVHEDEWLKARVETCIADPLACPMWDVAYFFDANAEWRGALPEPVAWTKQFGFAFDLTAPDAGMFWRSASPATLQRSAWTDEVAAHMAALGGRAR